MKEQLAEINFKSNNTAAVKPIFDYLVDPSFQGVNSLFVLSFRNDMVREAHTSYFLTNIEIQDYNAMIDSNSKTIYFRF